METVDELTGDEGGILRVTTLGSTHIVNLMRGTITRIPGVGRSARINDVERPLRTLDACKVGEVGRWTMISDDYLTECYWHHTSTIQRIERLTGMELVKATAEVALQNIAAGDGLFTASEVAEMIGESDAPVRQMFTSGQLIGLTWKDELAFPGCQFGPDHDQVAAFVQPLIAAAAEFGYSLRGLTFWLYSPTKHFGGARPVTFIDDPEALESAFRAQVGVEW
ncbi:MULTISPECIES: hypothetical protein [unclassified Cryobacterium]|uniref:hypothetical protein n=1 Tax=unclassified Cryobacterium TaxID=2649013 RepID=UPI002AB520D7|nr:MULTISPECIES: hypothetical protein [unclassified Cryobacterium]MDY7529219.1 hypothetical protein [Cryobacterium sp. 10C2]MDY7558620.1 hypothetical protein [Cryobacterium sp. 10C3]MEB0202572.1 hypothetical protein [Cryobacterium sp. 5I3]MEB0289696.1 hypothetical protein [Cryobacterium sp. 10C2]MEB0304512.1 hypothetical protein [Cryobacterium sp. 10I1]